MPRPVTLAASPSAEAPVAPIAGIPAEAAPAPPDAAARVRELARRSLSTGESIEILAALEGMTQTLTPESLDALSILAASNQDPEVRFQAVEVLRQLAAHRGDTDGGIRSVLRGLN